MIIVISPPYPVTNELQILHQLFDQGLQFFQIHKPDYSVQEIEEYVGKIQASHRPKVSVHENHLKFHSLEELQLHKEPYGHAFLSPIFNSISKKGYNSSFDLEEVGDFLPTTPKKIIALGGIDEDKVKTLLKMGFYGAGLLGAIWESKDPIGKFNRITKQWKS